MRDFTAGEMRDLRALLELEILTETILEARLVAFHEHMTEQLKMANAKLDELQAKVQAEDTVIASAKALIAGFPDIIKQAVTAARMDDNAQVDQIIADVKAQTDDLAASVATGPTGAPAANPAPVVPPPDVVVTPPADPVVSSASGSSTGGSTI